MPLHLRIARPVRDLAKSTYMYCRGLGLRVLASFEDHDGFDGFMLGVPGADYHLELTLRRGHPMHATPTAEDLLVFYVPQAAAWQDACATMIGAGFNEVAPVNPYWERRGCTFEDPDGYRIVLQNDLWSAG
jgi:catechol 2,3-dioxygenase-like lactoylglutathione lyase family enzyme